MKTREKPEGYSINYSSMNLSHMNMTKWSVKEKLYLISSVLMNGDSNWTKICQQLNKCMKFSSNFHTTPINPVLRTNNQCLKQYKFLVKNYTNRNGASDLKKIYNELAEERLKELKSVILENNQNFSYICKEIEQILAMDSPNLDELISIWNILKSDKEDTQKKKITTSNIVHDEDGERTLQRNLEKLFLIKQRQKDREEAFILEKKEKFERDKEREVDITINEEEKAKVLQEENPSIDLIDKTTIVKEKSSTINEKVEELFDKIRDLPNNKLEISLENTSDEILNEKRIESDNLAKEGSGIVWKPLISNSLTEKLQDVETPSSYTNLIEESNDKEMISQNSSPDSTLEKKPRRIPRVIDSSPSQSSRNGSISENDETELREKKTVEKAEIIFAPMINYCKKEDYTADSKESNVIDKDNLNEQSIVVENKVTRNSEIEETISKSDQETKSFQKPSEKNYKDSEAKGSQISCKSNEDVKSEREVVGRSGSLRSSNKNRCLHSNLQKRSNSVLKSKESDDQGQSKSDNLLNMVNRMQSKKVTSSDQFFNSESEINPSACSITSDSGLLSIIKTEPIQLSATSTISSSEQDKDLSNSDFNLSISTRTAKTQEAIQAPFSSSSTSSSQSNNSISSSKFEDEKAYRSWKKSIMMTLNNITCHKHATIFMQPVRDEIAPGYSSVVFRPMDLTTVKKNIETGVIKSTKVFQRDVMLMFTNAIMYNSSNHDVHKISIEMYREVLTEIEQLLNAQENKIEGDIKQIRSKDKRSSTNSDRSFFITGNDNESVESDVLVGIQFKATRKSSHNYNKEENNETESIKSSSSIQTVTHTRNKNKIDKLLSPNMTSSYTKKRRPSSSETNNSKKEETPMLKEPKSKKRRRSGR